MKKLMLKLDVINKDVVQGNGNPIWSWLMFIMPVSGKWQVQQWHTPWCEIDTVF